MHMTPNEIWTAMHGMVFGAGMLLLFSCGFFAISQLKAENLSELGLTRQVHRLSASTIVMAFFAWLTVLAGTYISYPSYRAKPPGAATSMSAAALQQYPKFYLLSNPQTADWHEFGMEWKEHIAWIVPILLTAVAYLVTAHGRTLATHRQLRQMVVLLFTVALFAAGVAGALGALINKAAPVR